MNGGSEKFKQLLHYVIYKVPNVGKNVLYKILYFTDFNYYELFEKKLSGEKYLKYPGGPAPCNFDEVIAELKKEGLIKETTHDLKFTSTSNPIMSKFSKEELEFIAVSISKYSGLKDISHNDTPYLVADDFEEIDYEFVFYRRSDLSVRTY